MQHSCLSLDQRVPAQLPARLAVVGVCLYVAVDVLLAFLRPDYSLIYNAESDYGRGAWSWVMDLNFLLRCALSLAAVVALYRSTSRSGRILSGLTLLGIWAVCSGLLAFFTDDLEGQPQHGSGIVHLVLAFVAFTAITVGTVLISTALTSDRAWRDMAPALVAISILGVIAYLLLGAALRHHHGPDGLFERIFLALQLLWIIFASVTITKRAPVDTPSHEPRSYGISTRSVKP